VPTEILIDDELELSERLPGKYDQKQSGAGNLTAARAVSRCLR
jgi:hypothetical protein